MFNYHLKDERLVTIRPANRTDALAMVIYLQQIPCESDYLTFGPGEVWVNEADEIAVISSAQSENCLMLVAIIDGCLVGNLHFRGGTRIRTRHTGEFGISVLKKYWGLGIGKTMLDYLLIWAKKSGIIKKINLRVRSDNLAAIHLYQKIGFINEGLIIHEYFINGQYYDALLMGITID